MNENDKILLVTFEFPPHKGGMQNYYYNLAKNFNPKKIVVLTTKSELGQPFDQKQQFKIYRYDLLYRFIFPRWLKLYFQIKKIVRQEGIGLIWVGDILPVGNAVYLISKKTKLPYFVSLHGLDLQLAQKNSFKISWTKKILNQARFVTCNSNFTKSLTTGLIQNQSKIEVIYPCPNLLPYGSTGMLIEAKIAELKNKFNLNNKKIILSVGRLVERKGHSLVIESLPEVVKKIPNLAYLIIGSGLELNKLKKLVISLNLAKYVLFLDQVDDNDLPGYYSLADLFILTTIADNYDIEGFGIVYLEASAFSLPIIASLAGGVAEAVIDKQTGILLKQVNQVSISQAITELLTNSEYAKLLGQNGRLRVKDQFNWTVQFNKLMQRINLL
jgi:phosphatidyl-myo-inositol dimannoside synthase